MILFLWEYLSWTCQFEWEHEDGTGSLSVRIRSDDPGPLLIPCILNLDGSTCVRSILSEHHSTHCLVKTIYSDPKHLIRRNHKVIKAQTVIIEVPQYHEIPNLCVYSSYRRILLSCTLVMSQFLPDPEDGSWVQDITLTHRISNFRTSCTARFYTD